MRAAKAALLLLSLIIVLSACGPNTGPTQGKVTDKIAPKGSTVCTGALANSCSSDDNYKVVIEDDNPKHALEVNWEVGYATVCVPPSVWRKIKMGQWYVLTHNDDLWCDG